MEKYQYTAFIEAAKAWISLPPHRINNPNAAVAALGDKHFSDYATYLRQIDEERNSSVVPENYELSEGLRTDLFGKFKLRKNAIIFLADKVLGVKIEGKSLTKPERPIITGSTTQTASENDIVVSSGIIPTQPSVIGKANAEEMADIIALGFNRHHQNKLFLGAALIQAHLRFAEMGKAESKIAKTEFNTRLCQKLGKTEAALQSEKQRLMAEFRQEMATCMGRSAPKLSDINGLRQFYMDSGKFMPAYIQQQLTSNTNAGKSTNSGTKSADKYPQAKEARVILSCGGTEYLKRFEKKKEDDKKRIVNSTVQAMSALNDFFDKAPNKYLMDHKALINEQIKRLEDIYDSLKENGVIPSSEGNPMANTQPT